MKRYAEIESYIRKNLTAHNCGIELYKIGQKDYERRFPVDLETEFLLDLDILEDEIDNEIIGFIESTIYTWNTSPIWYKINICDDAFNVYPGIGSIHKGTDWLSFIIFYLSIDRAGQGGDTLIIVFDIKLTWAIKFNLSQQDSSLIITRYTSDTSYY